MGTTQRVLGIIKQKQKEMLGGARLNEFEKSAKEFQKLINKGIVKSRGYNLQSIEDSHKTSVQFNV